MQTSSQVLWTPEWRCVMVTLKGSSGYFECQGHNSLNSGPILKILVPKHISFPRPSILICWTSTWHVPTWQKRVLKIVNEKWKSQKLKKMTFPSSCEQTLGRILDLHKISDLLGQRNDVLQTLGSWRKLASMVWPLFVIIWFVFWLDGLWSMANFWGRLYGHFEILQVKIGQEMEEL